MEYQDEEGYIYSILYSFMTNQLFWLFRQREKREMPEK